MHRVGCQLRPRLGWLPGLLAHLRQRFLDSLRFRLLALALLPILIAGPLLAAILATWGELHLDRLLIGKIRSDLAVANGHFEQVRNSVGRRVEALAGSERLARALAAPRPDTAVRDLLRDERRHTGVDFLLLLDAGGRVIAGSAGPARGEVFPLPAAYHERPGTHTGIEVVDSDVLGVIDPALAEKARTPLIETRNAVPSERTAEERGMLVQSRAPVEFPATPRGLHLVGGLLLNKNLDFVDRINEIVYPEGSLPLGSAGTATLFLDDVRIATNVRLFEGERAIGTRVSRDVRHRVLDEGSTWLDRAFVVKDWYVSGYDPILDSSGKRVGMLYVGFLEAPFQEARWLTLAAVGLLFLLAAGIAVAVSLRLARTVSTPVERMHAVMSALESGSGQTRVGTPTGTDELAELGAHFDRLLDRLAEQTAALQRWAESLDSMVAERTRELAAANESLRSAQQRLVMSEKLAAIGQLAAGVAHEVNNPVAVIQGNLDVLREALGSSAEPVLPEIRLIQDQVFRIRLIVTKLLQFARPADFAGYIEPVAADQVVRDSLVLVEHQFRKTRISVVEDLRPTPPVFINRNELQQVLINLMVNALQAMDMGRSGSTLTLRCEAAERDGVAGAGITIADDGAGIAEDVRARLFDPFFTTKTRDGSGLGLWVSQGIVQRYGGRIEVDCPATGGSVFSVWLPLGSGTLNSATG